MKKMDFGETYSKFLSHSYREDSPSNNAARLCHTI